MPDTEFQFQRLPSTAELNTISPTTYRSQHSSWQEEGSTSFRMTTLSEESEQPIKVIPQQWPMQPEVLAASPVYKFAGLVGHALLTLSPIIFLMLAFAALSVDGKPRSRRGQIILEAAKVAPTLFPIIFAAVVGRLLRTYALWRAERGSSIGILEQLNGSQNFLAAVERAFHLHGGRGVGLLIIALWGLSPLGGQSSLRVLSISESGNTREVNLNYFNVDNYTQSAFQGASALGYGWPTISAIYQACLLAPDKVISSSIDLWGNVKIPLMQSLNGYTGSHDQDWIAVPEDADYSSLSGIMIAGLNRNDTFNLTMETSYLNLSCSDPQRFNPNFTSDTDPYQDIRQWAGDLTLHSNVSGPLFGDPNANMDSGDRVWSSFTLDTNWNYTDPAFTNQSNINVIYLSQNADTEDYVVTGYKCELGYTHLEASIDCEGVDCTVTHVRPSRKPYLPPNITPFNQGIFTYFSLLIKNLPWATGQQHSAVTSPTDWYVAGSERPYNLSFNSADYTAVSGLQVSRRLGTLLNTLWQTSMTQSALVQPRTLNATEQIGPLDYDAIPVTAMAQTKRDVYVASKIWVSFTIIISFIMTFCGIAGAFFKYASKAPDILGYVSSLTKDNPYFQGPTGSDNLDGIERSRLLKNVVVQLGNVKPWDDRGYIALRRIGEGEDRKSGRLKRPYHDDSPHDHDVH